MAKYCQARLHMGGLSWIGLDIYGNLLHNRLQNYFDARVFIAGLVYGKVYGFLKFDLLNVLR